jgi:hypothetical protein
LWDISHRLLPDYSHKDIFISLQFAPGGSRIAMKFVGRPFPEVTAIAKAAAILKAAAKATRLLRLIAEAALSASALTATLRPSKPQKITLLLWLGHDPRLALSTPTNREVA